MPLLAMPLLLSLSGLILMQSPRPVSVARRRAHLSLEFTDFDTPLPANLDDDAAALLEEAGGDIDKARTSYIGYTLAYLEEAMPELYRALKVDPNLPEAHAALTEVTWDAIAAFMPRTHASRPTPAAAQRLMAIARAAVPGDGERSVLDVGCGHGLLVPFVTECGLPASGYRGIDLSSRMVALAEHAHGESGAKFEDMSFADECEQAQRKYDTIVFNGALQFFDDQAGTLASAEELLSDSEDARIIVSHVSGASFVRKELGDNPNTVRNTMPFLASMQQIASRLGMQVVLPSFLGTEPDAIEQALEAFYLVIFVRAGSDADDDADDDAEGSNVLELPVGLQQSDLLK